MPTVDDQAAIQATGTLTSEKKILEVRYSDETGARFSKRASVPGVDAGSRGSYCHAFAVTTRASYPETRGSSGKGKLPIKEQGERVLLLYLILNANRQTLLAAQTAAVVKVVKLRSQASSLDR